MKTDILRSDAGLFPWLVYKTLHEMGHDADLIYGHVDKNGVSRNKPQPDMRYDNRVQTQFWQDAARISQDPLIGLHVGQRLPVFRGQIFEYLFMSSANFGEALMVLLDHYRYFSSALDIQLGFKDEHAYLVGFDHESPHYLHCVVSIVLSFLQHVSRGQFHPTAIWLCHHQPDASPFEHTWQCPVAFNMPQGCIQFPTVLLEQSSETAEPLLFDLHRDAILQKLSWVECHDLIFKIQAVLPEQLQRREYRIEDIATCLNCSVRHMRQQLKVLNTTYEKVLHDFRKKLARDLVLDINISSDEVVYLTGFSEISAFSRAFKEWTGESPSQYRKRIQQKLSLSA